MSRIVEYKILTNTYSDMLAIDVNDAIKEGWQPAGGVCCSAYEESSRDYYGDIVNTYSVYTYQQAVVRYADV